MQAQSLAGIGSSLATLFGDSQTSRSTSGVPVRRVREVWIVYGAALSFEAAHFNGGKDGVRRFHRFPDESSTSSRFRMLPVARPFPVRTPVPALFQQSVAIAALGTVQARYLPILLS